MEHDPTDPAPIVRSRSRTLVRRIRLALEGIGLLAVVATLALAGGYLWFVSQLELHEPAYARRGDAIVVLTGGASRIADGLDLLDRGHGRRLLITGVHWATTKGEIARLAPDNAELLDCCVDLDHQAMNTIGNAAETGAWARRHRFTSLVVVTSSYHMPRALAELDAVLPDVVKLPYPVVSGRLKAKPWWGNADTARLLFVEYVKYVAARVRLGLEPIVTDSRTAAAPGSGRAAAATR